MYSKVSLLALLVVLIAVGKGAWDIHQKAVVAETERDITERSLVDLQSRNTELRASMANLMSGQGIETAVRQKYTVARPGEELVVVVDDTTKKSENGDAINTKSFWQQIVSFFGF